MEPENQTPLEDLAAETPQSETALPFESQDIEPAAPEYRGLRWMFIGDQGLRAGWSVLIFLVLTLLIMVALGAAATLIAHKILHVKTGNFTPLTGFIQEVISFLALLGAGAVMALIERRRILDYNLTGPRRFSHFLGGLAAGFAALSALVGAMAWGGWLHFGPVALSGAQIFGYAALWGAVFLLTGFLRRAASAAICNTRSPAASTSGGRWASSAQSASNCC